MQAEFLILAHSPAELEVPARNEGQESRTEPRTGCSWPSELRLWLHREGKSAAPSTRSKKNSKKPKKLIQSSPPPCKPGSAPHSGVLCISSNFENNTKDRQKKDKKTKKKTKQRTKGKAAVHVYLVQMVPSPPGWHREGPSPAAPAQPWFGLVWTGLKPCSRGGCILALLHILGTRWAKHFEFLLL